MSSPVRAVRITGFTRLPRVEAIACVRDTIGACGGFILDTYMYSNAMLALNFELRASRVSSLVQALENAGLSMTLESVQGFGALSDTEADPVVAGSMNVNFIHDDPPLRIEVPAVPG